MDDQDKIDMILTWASDHPQFNIDFVMDLQEQLDDRGGLSDAQSEALDNIIEKWKID